MNPFVAIASFFAAANAQYIAPLAANGYYANAPVVQAPYVAAAPAPYVAAAPAPVVAAAPAPVAPLTAPSSQFQAQDEFGNVQYGYSNINSAKTEVGNAYGGVAGSYSYVDPNGELQRVEYIADGLGFRVKATNLPVAPDTPVAKALEAPVFDLEAPVFTGEAPAPVEETAEVKAAKEEFFAKFEEAKNRQRRSVIAPYAYTYAAPAYAGLAPVEAKTPAATVKAEHAYVAPAPIAYNYAPVAAPALAPAVTYAAAPAVAAPVTYATAPAVAPVTYAAPAVAAAPAVESTLTTIKLNPGHAVAYRFD